jgi:hypothetical protein
VLLLKLVPTPTGSAPAYTPSGAALPRMSRNELLDRPQRRLVLSLQSVPAPAPETIEDDPYPVLF